MLLRVRLWEEVGGVRQSTYWWANDFLLPSSLSAVEMLGNRAATMATFLRVAHALDHRYVSWEGQLYSDDGSTKLSSWLAGDIPLGPVAGIVFGFSGGPEIALRLEQRSLTRAVVVLRYMPFIPEDFLSGGVNINILGLSAWGLATLGLRSVVRMYMPVRGEDESFVIHPSAEITTLNSRRKRVPQYSNDPVYP